MDSKHIVINTLIRNFHIIYTHVYVNCQNTKLPLPIGNSELTQAAVSSILPRKQQPSPYSASRSPKRQGYEESRDGDTLSFCPLDVWYACSALKSAGYSVRTIAITSVRRKLREGEAMRRGEALDSRTQVCVSTLRGGLLLQAGKDE